MAGEIQARLHHLGLYSPEPQRLARFYADAYGVKSIHVAQGTANRLAFAAFAFDDAKALAAYRKQLKVPLAASPSPFFGTEAFGVTDPDGNVIVFGVRPAGAANPHARLQHLATRTTQPAVLREFYCDQLGFVCSDRVLDEAGNLRACFLRTDEEHHALAVFHSPEQRHDHLSFETTDWAAVRDWADQLVARGIEIVWGVGRHGPGNDVFFMVRDPDGNLAEISAELERIAPGRPEGKWRHEPRTLNLWGAAIMRS